MKHSTLALAMVPADGLDVWPEGSEAKPQLLPIGPMVDVLALADRVAIGDISVLILGETGVGKELLADRVHDRSRRSGGPIVKLNCTAMPEHLLESELFGYEKGAFTGAVTAKAGLLEQAEGGSVVLDEIGELPLATQAKLLRVIEQREIWRVGALRPRPINVRFISATHRDLEAAIAAGRFREDLYFRIAGVTLQMPSLRDRVDEIMPLAERFAARAAAHLGRMIPSIAPAAKELLLAFRWPGNVRELRNTIERATLLCEDVIDLCHLPVDRIGRAVAAAMPQHAGLGEVRARADELERLAIEQALGRTNGNQTEAAKQLGISRRTLTNKLNTYSIDRPRKRK